MEVVNSLIGFKSRGYSMQAHRRKRVDLLRIMTLELWKGYEQKLEPLESPTVVVETHIHEPIWRPSHRIQKARSLVHLVGTTAILRNTFASMRCCEIVSEQTILRLKSLQNMLTFVQHRLASLFQTGADKRVANFLRRHLPIALGRTFLGLGRLLGPCEWKTLSLRSVSEFKFGLGEAEQLSVGDFTHPLWNHPILVMNIVIWKHPRRPF